MLSPISIWDEKSEISMLSTINRVAEISALRERQKENRLVVSSKPSSEICCAFKSFIVEEAFSRGLFVGE